MLWFMNPEAEIAMVKQTHQPTDKKNKTPKNQLTKKGVRIITPE